MKVLSKEDKAIYETVMSVVKFKKIELNNTPVPKGWMDDIRRIKV